MNNIFDLAGFVLPVADRAGITQAWRTMLVERTPAACLAAMNAATDADNDDLCDIAEACNTFSVAIEMQNSAIITAQNIISRMKHSESSHA